MGAMRFAVALAPAMRFAVDPVPAMRFAVAPASAIRFAVAQVPPHFCVAGAVFLQCDIVI